MDQFAGNIRQAIVATIKPVGQLFVIDAKQMHADGHAFFVTGNYVWLTDHVPPVYLSLESES